jgi:hypothetical protein
VDRAIGVDGDEAAHLLVGEFVEATEGEASAQPIGEHKQQQRRQDRHDRRADTAEAKPESQAQAVIHACRVSAGCLDCGKLWWWRQHQERQH